MKIAVISRYPKSSKKPKGGVESVTVVLLKALASLEDMEVHVLTVEKELFKEVFELDGNIRIHRLLVSNCPQILDILCGPGRKKILHKIEEISPDVVHSHETFGLTLRLKNIPHVFTLHCFDHANVIADSEKMRHIRSVLWKIVERYGLSCQTNIISISPYVKDMIEPHTSATIYDIDNPVDELFFNIKRKEQLGRILCVGWISERKNTIASVKAFASAIEQGYNCNLIIAGESKDKTYMDRLNNLIKDKGLLSKIEFVGHINQSQLGEELEKASVMLLPSLQENAPMAITEAMAAGVPVITSNRCGMPYIVEENKSGFVFFNYVWH